jgi:hypothetical protein
MASAVDPRSDSKPAAAPAAQRRKARKVHAMSTVPQLGTYLSQDGHVKIQIDGANPSNGQITGIYATNESPEGPLTVKGAIGIYEWVANQQGQAGAAPFCIRFTASIRPDKFPYCIVDTWNGAYQTDNTLLLAGTRAYVNNKGVVQISFLGTQTFRK